MANAIKTCKKHNSGTQGTKVYSIMTLRLKT